MKVIGTTRFSYRTQFLSLKVRKELIRCMENLFMVIELRFDVQMKKRNRYHYLCIVLIKQNTS